MDGFDLWIIVSSVIRITSSMINVGTTGEGSVADIASNCCELRPMGLRHVFGRRQPLAHVVAEHRGDVEKDEQRARHAQQQHRRLAGARLHYCHGFFWKKNHNV